MRRVVAFVAFVGMLMPAIAWETGPLGAAPNRAGDRVHDNEERVKHQQIGDHEHSDASGKVRPDLWRKGIAQMQQLRIAAGRPVSTAPTAGGARPASTTRAFAAAPSTPLQGVQWTQIGPQPLRIDAEQVFQGSGPDAGEVVDVAIDPRGTSDQVIYVATNDGGVWKSTDGGASWAPKTDHMPSLSTGAVALDPTNPSIVYAGTGDIFDGGVTFSKGVGIYKSTDSGDTWSVVPGSAALVNAGARVNRIVMPAANVLLVATDKGLFRSVDGGTSFGANSPTFNDGNPITNGFISDLDLDTASPSTTVYEAVAGVGIRRSTDGGVTFPTNLFDGTHGSVAAGTYGYITFAQSTADGSTANSQVMMAALAAPGPAGFSRGFKGIFRSSDSGSNWAAVGGQNDPDNYLSSNFSGTKCQCGYDETLGIDPLDSTSVYFGVQEVFHSSNSGGSFSQVSENKIHWDNHALVFSPHRPTSAPTAFYVGTDGGLSRTTDGGSNWSNLNEGVGTNLFQSIDMGRGSAANNAYTFGGMQDTGIAEHKTGFTGTDWHLARDGDGGSTVVDPTNAQNAFSLDDGCLSKSTDGGSSWSNDLPSGGIPQCGSGGAAGASLLALDPNTPATLYAAAGNGDQLWRSTDSGGSMADMKDFSNGTTISAIGTTKTDSNVLWVGFADGTLQYTTNALQGTSATWTARTVPGIIAGQGVSAIAVDPGNTNQVVVTYPGFANSGTNPTKHVFLTNDAGANWSDISGVSGGTQNLPDLPVHSVVIDPGTSPHTIIVANDAGVLRTLDQGGTWQIYGVGLPTVDSKSLAIDTSVNPPILRLGTYGRSAYELTAPTGPMVAVNADLAFGNVGVGQTADRIMQVFNVGSTDLHISSISRSGSADFQIVSGPATPVTVTPGEEIDYTIRFSPSSVGAKSATFTINSDDPNQPAFAVPASGTGVAPQIVVSGSLAFGTVIRGTVATRQIQVANTGGAPLQVSSVAFNGTSDPGFSVLNPSTPQTIAPGSSLLWTVQFAPPANSAGGDVTGTLVIVSNDPVNPSVNVPASAHIGIPVATVSGDLNFGTVARGTTATKQVLVQNTGEAPLHVSSVAFDGSSSTMFSVLGPATPVTVQPGSSVAFTVQFAPPANAGPSSPTGTLVISSDDPAHPTVSIPASGTVGVPVVTLSSTSLDFGSVAVDNRTTPDSADRVLVITNQSSCSSCDVSITGLGITGTNASDFSVVGAPTTPFSIGAGSQISLTIRFNPSASGTRTATLTVTSSDPVNPSQPVSLTGVGLLPSITPTPTPLIFGPTVYDPNCGAVCGSTLPLTISDTGLVELLLDVLTFTGPYLGPAVTSPVTRVQAGHSFTENVTFHPTGGPARKVTGNLHIQDSLPLDPGNTVATDVPFCGESVGRGIRVLVVDKSGNPVANVDSLKLSATGVSAPPNVNLKNLPLQTINPPTSCQTIKMQYENQSLSSTDQSAPRGSYYTLAVSVGTKKATLTFTLAVNEFKQLVVTVG